MGSSASTTKTINKNKRVPFLDLNSFQTNTIKSKEIETFIIEEINVSHFLAVTYWGNESWFVSISRLENSNPNHDLSIKCHFHTQNMHLKDYSTHESSIKDLYLF